MVEQLPVLERRQQLIVLKIVVGGAPSKMGVVRVVSLPPLAKVNQLFNQLAVIARSDVIAKMVLIRYLKIL